MIKIQDNIQNEYYQNNIHTGVLSVRYVEGSVDVRVYNTNISVA